LSASPKDDPIIPHYCRISPHERGDCWIDGSRDKPRVTVAFEATGSVRIGKLRISSNDALVAQALGVAGGEAAERAQQVVGVLAQQRRAAHGDGRVRQLDRAADGLIRAAVG
jgi:hypothetical protein